MKKICFALVLFSLASNVFAAGLAPIPSQPIAEKKELLFSDNFDSSDVAKTWHKVVPTFAFEAGALKGTQTREKDMPAANGKSVIKALLPSMVWKSPPRTASSRPRSASMGPR